MRKSFVYFIIIFIAFASLALYAALIYEPSPDLKSVHKEAVSSESLPKETVTGAMPPATPDIVIPKTSPLTSANNLIVKKPLTKEDIEKYRAAVRERKRQEAIAQGKLAEFEAKEAEREKQEKAREQRRAEKKKLFEERRKINEEMRQALKEGRLSPEKRHELMARREEITKKLRALE